MDKATQNFGDRLLITACSTKNELALRSDTGVQFLYGPGGRFDAIMSGSTVTGSSMTARRSPLSLAEVP